MKKNALLTLYMGKQDFGSRKKFFSGIRIRSTVEGLNPNYCPEHVVLETFG